MFNQAKKFLLISLSCWVTLNVSLAQTIDADSLFLKARDFASAGRYDDARMASRELLSLYPDYFDASLLIGKTYVWEQKTDLARMALVPLLNVEPENHDLLTSLIDNAITDKKHDEADTYIDRALRYYPRDTEILYRKAYNLSLKGERTASLEVVEQILAINPNHAGAEDLKGYVDTSVGILYMQAEDEARIGRHEQAREMLRKVLTENPNHFDASLLMAYTYGWDGKYDSARLITQQLVKLIRTVTSCLT